MGGAQGAQAPANQTFFGEVMGVSVDPRTHVIGYEIMNEFHVRKWGYAGVKTKLSRNGLECIPREIVAGDMAGAVFYGNGQELASIAATSKAPTVKLTPEQAEKQKEASLKARREKGEKFLQYQLEQALAGKAEYQYDLGMRYTTGDEIVTKDEPKGMEWLEKSAAQNYAKAVTKLKVLKEMKTATAPAADSTPPATEAKK